jgi:ribosomal protein S18 acetylase RimI-like enzyme
MSTIEYKENVSRYAQVLFHLEYCNEQFSPNLSKRVSLEDYSKKIVERAVRFEAWSDNRLIGLLAMYTGDATSPKAFITNVSIEKDFCNKGIASCLLNSAKEYSKNMACNNIFLEVAEENMQAIKLYVKSGFVTVKKENKIITMTINLKAE